MNVNFCIDNHFWGLTLRCNVDIDINMEKTYDVINDMKPACPHIRRIADVRMAQWDLTQAQLASNHRLTPQNLSAMINSVNPNAKTLIFLSKILDVPITLFFEQEVCNVLTALTPVPTSKSLPGAA